MNRSQRRERNPRFSLRLALRWSTGRYFDALWVGTFRESETALQRTEQALQLIKRYDPVRYGRIVKDVERVWVRLLPNILGNFDDSIHACELDTRFVLASPPELVAATIVHEATHARLHHRGIGYEEELRARVEAVCFRRELAFAAKLPHGEQVHEQAGRSLALCVSPDHWTNASLNEHFLEGYVETLRDFGVPNWLLRVLLALRTLRIEVGHVVRRLTSS